MVLRVWYCLSELQVGNKKPRRGTTFKKLLESWKIWGIPALVEMLMPWQSKITDLKLISDYWQPGLNGFSSAAGAVAAMAAFAFLHDRPRKAQRYWAKISTLIFVLCFVLCLAFILTVGSVWSPDPSWQWLVWLIWILAYVLVFAASASLIIALLLAGTRRN